MNEFDDELLRTVATELLNALHSHPEWITQDEDLRKTATRLETERLLSPEVLVALLVPIFRVRIPPKEMVRLTTLLEAGDVEQVVIALRRVLDQYAEEEGLHTLLQRSNDGMED